MGLNPGGAGPAQNNNNNMMDENFGDGGMNAGDFMDMNDLPADEIDPELQRILEMSRNDK